MAVRRKTVPKASTGRPKATRPLATPRLACPFYARQPQNCTKSASCNGAGFETPARVVEHLKRNHRPGSELNPVDSCTDPELSRDNSALSYDCHEQITAEQLDQINSLAAKKYAPTEKWAKIYSIIFPGDADTPSPHANLVQQVYDYASQCSDWLLDSLSERLPLKREDIITVLKFLPRLLPVVFEVTRQRGRQRARLFKRPQGSKPSSDSSGNPRSGLSHEDTSAGIHTPAASCPGSSTDIPFNLSPEIMEFVNEVPRIDGVPRVGLQVDDLVDIDRDTILPTVEDTERLLSWEDEVLQFIDFEGAGNSSCVDWD